jgi:hypothetical protein
MICSQLAVAELCARLLKAHPEVQVVPHKYDPQGHYLIFPTADNEAGIVMEIGDDKVADIRPGLRPSVDHVECCL